MHTLWAWCGIDHRGVSCSNQTSLPLHFGQAFWGRSSNASKLWNVVILPITGKIEHTINLWVFVTASVLIENLGSVAVSHMPWGLQSCFPFTSATLVHHMILPKFMAVTFNATKDFKRNRGCKYCFQWLRMNTKKCVATFQKCLCLSGTGGKPKNVEALLWMQILSHSSHHNTVKDKAILKGVKASSSCTNAMILSSLLSKS